MHKAVRNIEDAVAVEAADTKKKAPAVCLKPVHFVES